MKTKLFTILAVVISMRVCPVQADTVWTSGHHEIFDGDTYGEVRIYNDVILDIFGGYIGRLETYDITVTDWYDGEMSHLWTYDDSIINVYGGELFTLYSHEDSLINLYAYDVLITDTGGYWNLGQVTGKYFSDNSSFIINLWSEDTASHINIVPEPTTLILFGIGTLLLRKKQ